jgi:O-antigen ligase
VIANTVQHVWADKRWRTALIILGVLVVAFALGHRPSPVYLALPVALAGALILLRYPVLGLPLMIVTALLVPVEFSTGTDVSLNPVALLVPVLFGMWILTRMHQQDLRLTPSLTTRPLIFFLLSALLSFFIGTLIWDPNVPKSDRFPIVQMAQWALFVFSALAFWLVGNLIKSELNLKRLTAFFLIVAGALSILRMVQPIWGLVEHFTTFALLRAPFWMALAALALGQLTFNAELSRRWQIFLALAVVGVFIYSFVGQAERTSNWVSVGVIVYLLAWLRLPRFRTLFIVAAILGATVFFPVIYQFGGGDAKWDESGASRLVLSGRVVEVTMRNPITGLGPAAYRPYANNKPLQYGKAYWLEPRINSHNNYVDLFAQTGIIGLIFYFWFIVSLFRVGFRLRQTYRTGFAAGYVNAMIAALGGVCVVMLLLDWFLPFVYNVGFPGFQASVLLWMFLGGLVSLENIARQKNLAKVDAAHVA